MGRGSAQVRITLRNIKRGQTVERSFQAGTKWPRASMEKRPVQFLYRDGDDYHFMDNDTYDQFVLTAEQLGDAAQYLKDGMTLDRTSYQGETIGVELPVTVDLVVADTEPGFAGDTQTGARKPATTETGPRRPGPDLRRERATRSASTPGPASTRPGSSAGCCRPWSASRTKRRTTRARTARFADLAGGPPAGPATGDGRPSRTPYARTGRPTRWRQAAMMSA